MPPKAKYTREEIVANALDLVREKGIAALTARELGARLNTSSRPIFTAFANMEDVQAEVFKAAKEMFHTYTQGFEEYTPAFKRFGMQWILFAMNEPKLFELLFMQKHEQKTAFAEIAFDFLDNPEELLGVIKKDYLLNDEQAKILYNQLWVQTYGICVLSVTGLCSFTQQEIEEVLGNAVKGTLLLLKKG